jgi:sugar phosphate isomerase/epimerase
MGISTGVLGGLWGNWPALVSRACQISTYAIELSALSGAELPGLIRYLRSGPRLPFRYVSVHAPAKAFDGQNVSALGEIPMWLRSIVAHPDAIGDARPYRALGTRLLVENMDGRKRTGRTSEELQGCFDELPDAGFVLDIAHAHSLDPSMELAHELLDRFRARLRHVHLSSLGVSGEHMPLTVEDEDLFAGVLDRCRDVPWILEAEPPERWAAELRGTGLRLVS